MLKNDNELISPEYKNFYDRLILDLQIDKPKEENIRHPHFAIKFKNSDFDFYEKIIEKLSSRKSKRVAIFHKESLGERILESRNLICFSDKSLLKELEMLKKLSFDSFIKTMPPITSSDVAQNPKKIARLFTLDCRKWFVVVQISKPTEYISNKISLDHAFSKYKNLSTVKKWAIVNELGKSFFIGQFLGYTFEQKIKYKSFNSNQIKIILNNILTAKQALESADLFWREFAPRNMFVDQIGQIIFTDFENLYVKSELDKVKLNYLEQVSSVWFADIFNLKLISQITGIRIGLDPNLLVESDKIEKSMFNKERIKSIFRRKLFDITRKLEKKHVKDRHVVYGHRIGRFISDFFDVELEAKLLKLIGGLKSTNLFIFLSTLQFLVDVDMETLLRDFYLEEKKKTYRLYSVDFIERYNHRWIKKHKSDSLEFIYKSEENYKTVLTKANYLLK